MTSARFWLVLSLAALAGCGASPSGEDLASLTQAVNACNETVPANRFVDGLPAYAQCSGVSSGSIWSNNGIDTSTTSGGTDWIQTQRGGGYQCTEWAYRYMRFRWNVSYRNGDAKGWCSGSLPSNLVKATTPVHGDLIVFDAGVCGSDATTGHVAVVDTVNASTASVTLVEENDAGRRNSKQSCALCFLHAVANDGSGAGGTSGAAGGGGANGPGGSGAGAGGSTTAGASSGGSGASGGFVMNGGRSSAGGRPNAAGGAAASGGRSPNAGGGSTQNGGTAPGGATSGGTASGGGSPATGGSGGARPSSGGSQASGGSNESNASFGGAASPRGGAGGTQSGGSAVDGGRTNDVQGSCSCSVPGAQVGLGASSFGSALWVLGALVLRRKRGAATADGASAR